MGAKPSHSNRHATALEAMPSAVIENSVRLSQREVSTDPLLAACRVYSRLTLAGGAASFALNALLLLLCGSEMTLTEFALRAYAAVLSGVVCAAELEWPRVAEGAAFLESWVLRGLFVAFVGVVDLLFDYERYSFLDALRVWTGCFLLGAGLLYTAMGALCFRQLKLWAVKRIRKKKLMKAEVQHLSAQKEEIERLLADTSSKLEAF